MTGHAQDERPTLVLGGTGKTGRRVVDRLEVRGLPVRVGSRWGEPPFDWEDRSTWSPALDGVGSVYLSYYPDLAVPGAVEAAGEIRLPGRDVPTPFLDIDDLADITVAALTDDRHVGQLYELTGPRSLTFHEVAAEIGEAAGRQVRYAPISLDQHATEAAEHGVPADVIEMLTYLFSEVVDGRNADTTDGVRRALGREARNFRDYARNVAATGLWSESAVNA
jgi:uncharacterized protein YbjT (DUF2867 family)